LLTRLEQTQPIEGTEIVALSEHVDYWNRLGWTDPYSSSVFSARQDDYARVFNIDGVYTPQMVVDGRMQFVGSDATKAREAIAGASGASKVKITVRMASEDVKKASLVLDISIAQSPQISAESAEVFLAVAEKGLRSSVARGENAGRSLGHTSVVRKLTSIGKFDPQEPEAFMAQPVIQVNESWKRQNLKVVVFAQERKSRRVLGVASIALAG
jgi:hypothetical protein